ncbi:MAG: hypothetical protein HYX75_17525 [Acidobacteria bacterium]|nr:hypothetical protein [Acidobacteriota bacterium]
MTVRFPLTTRDTIMITALPLLLAALAGAATPVNPTPGKLTIIPETFVRGYDPVTVFFAGATGPGTDVPEDHPEKYVKVSPSHPGEFRWIDPSTLIFKPAVPWPPLMRFRWTAGSTTRTLTTMMIQPVAITPSDGTTGLDPIEELTIAFREPIDVKDLAKMVTFEIRRLPGVGKGNARWLTSEDYAIKPVERGSLKDQASYVFRFTRPIEAGMKAVLHIRLSLDDTSPDSLVEYSFSTKEVFRILAAGCVAESESTPQSWRERPSSYEEEEYEEEEYEGDDEDEEYEEEEQPEYDYSPSYGRNILLPLTTSGTKYTKEQAVNGGTGTPKIAIQFSAEIAPLSLSAVKSLVRFSPTIPEMSFTQSGPYLYITGKMAKETVYTATISPSPIKDKTGRLLTIEGPSQFCFYFPPQAPFLRWSQSQGIIERYGPQMFPMSGRGDTRVDLRIYKVDPLDRNFWPFPEQAVIVNEMEAPPGPGEEPEPAEKLHDYLHADQLALRLKNIGAPPVSKIVTVPLRKEGGTTQFGLALKEHLQAISGPAEPGTYIVGVRRLSEESQRTYVRVQVTDLSLTTVEEERAIEFLVTSLKTGSPVPTATVLVEGIPEGSKSNAYEALITGVTDERGLFRWEHKGRIKADLRRIIVRNGKDTLVLMPDDPPYSFADNHWYGPHGTWLEWITNDPYKDPEASTRMCHILTERPVYRPEEEVHIKGYLRLRERGRLTIPASRKYEILITAPGEKLWTFPVEITAEGSFYFKFQEKELPTGVYTATLRDIEDQEEYGSVDWKMEAYKIPRFEVLIHGPDRVPMDRELEMSATASYYAGGRVVGQPVLWRVTQFPYAYVPEQRAGYLFSSDERFSRPGRFTSTGAIEKSDKTDDSGATKISVNPALEIDARPRQYIFEVTITGADDQTVSQTRQVLALPPFVLGLQVDRFIKNSKTISPKIIAIDVDNNLLAGQEVSVRLLAREWHSHLRETDFADGIPKYVTDMVDREVSTTTISTTDKPVSLDLNVDKAGIYVVELSSRDKIGRLQLVTADLYVAGDEPVTWKKPDANVFETTTDKKEYVAGETAQILLKSPFQQASALAVIEGPDGNIYQEIQVTGGKAVFTLPIKNEYNPRVPVHFVLMRGRISSGLAAGSNLDLGKPQTMAATQWLKVDPADNKMNIELKHPEKAMPGQTITMQIKLATPGGKPLPGEVTLWLVDQAVLSLGKEKRLDPLPSFIKDVGSHISVRDTRNKIIGEIATVEGEGGGGAEEEPDLLGKVTIRKEFKTVPYYNPRIMVDKTGVVEIQIKLSDDLTNFKVRAVACSGPDRFGFAKSTIAVRLPVIVQPALPRFVRIGDELVAGGIGRIVEGEGGPGSCQVQVDGATLGGGTTRSLQWIKDKPERLYFPMTVGVPAGGKKDNLTLRLAVKRDSDGAADAFEVSIPVLSDRDPVRQEIFKRLELGKSASFPAVTEKTRPGSFSQSLLITDQEALLRMISGLDYLYSYTHLCTEQRVSQTYPAIALKGIYDTFKIRAPEEKINELLTYTFDYLGKTLQPNGLYSYWPGGKGYVTLTAQVVEFLAEAKRSGYQFQPKLLERPVAALKQALRSDYAYFIDGWAWMERSEALMALSAAGEFDASYGSELGRKAGFLDLYSEAKVLSAFTFGQKASKSVTDGLRKDLWDNTVIKLRDGHEVYGGLQSRIKSWGGLVLTSEIKTQAAMIRALYPTDAQNPKMQLMLSDLIERGQKDGWGNTNTNSAALLALRDVLMSTKTDRKPADFKVSFGDSRESLHIGPDQPTASITTRDARPAAIEMTQGHGNVFARMTVTYVPAATGETVAAKSDGFVVRREIVRVSHDASPSVKEWIEKAGVTFEHTVGDVVEEHIQIVNPEDRNYVAVVGPFAAGMEPLNPNLATAPQEARPAGTNTLEATYAMYLDDEVRFYFETLPKGTYDFYFRVRASTEGSFVHPPARAEMMYQPTVRGNSVGARFVIHATKEQ